MNTLILTQKRHFEQTPTRRAQVEAMLRAAGYCLTRHAAGYVQIMPQHTAEMRISRER